MPRNKRKRRRRKSAKRVARGKKLARTLPRDAKGKFLPAGSKNLFRKKKKRRRRRSVPAKKRSQTKQIKKRKLTRTRSLPNMSRRRKTRDDFPNFLSGFIAMNTATVFVQKTINTPIPRLKSIGNRATVMELLFCDMVQGGVSFEDTSTTIQFQMALGTPQTSVLPFSDTRVFLDYRLIASARPTPGTDVSFLTAFGAPTRYQFQTMDGFGYLLTADSFRLGLIATNTIDLARIDFKLYYRFVDIPLSEFIGIVQSNQAQ